MSITTETKIIVTASCDYIGGCGVFVQSPSHAAFASVLQTDGWFIADDESVCGCPKHAAEVKAVSER